MKSYLLVFEPSQVGQKHWIDIVDGISTIENWHSVFEGAMVLISDADAKEITRAIQDELSNTRFLVTELRTGSKGGWLPRSIWQFINNPRPVGAI